MCGFTISNQLERADILLKLSTEYAFRGPDEFQSLLSEDVVAIHRRLNIRGGSTGKQPLVNENGDVLVYNGEIYAFEGHRLETSSDTAWLFENLLACGGASSIAEFLAKVDGMYSFVFYAASRRAFICGRDRYGQKPLYFRNCESGLAFSTTSTALIDTSEREVDSHSVLEFLEYGYLTPNRSIWKGIESISPGLLYEFDSVSGGRSEFPIHEEMQELSKPDQCGSRTKDRRLWVRRDASHLLETRISESIGRRLISDRPVGLLLSGGIDSSLVAAFVARVFNRTDISASHVVAGDGEFSEQTEANFFAQHLGLQLNAERISGEGLSSLLEAHQKLDEPMGDHSFLPTLAAYRLAAQTSVVVLTGDGADEFYWGYAAMRLRSWMIPGIRMIRPILIQLLKLRPLKRWVTKQSQLRSVSIWLLLLRLAANPVRGNVETLLHQVMSPLGSLDSHDRQLLLSDGSDVLGLSVKGRAVNGVKSYFLNYGLPGNICTKIDRASMLNGVEARACFLSTDLEKESCSAGAPWFFKKHGKRGLVRIHERYFPSHTRKAKKKGFAPPTSKLFKENVLDIKSTPEIPGVNMAMLLSIQEAHRRGEDDHRNLLYAAYALQTFLVAHGGSLISKS